MRTGKIGERVERIEDETLLTGRGKYVADMRLDGMLHAAFIRSPHAHAKIRDINTDEARNIPGVYGIYTLADLEKIAKGPMPLVFPHPALRKPLTQFPLAKDEVCYVGEGVAVVLATSRHIAEDAAALVDVDYNPLDAVASIDDAVAGEILAHEDAESNTVASLKIGFGDCDATFAEADAIVTDHIVMHRGGCHSMECRGVLAQFARTADELRIWTSTQSPYSVSRFVAQYVGMETSDVHVAAPNVGGGFGPKAAVYPEEYVIPVLSMLVGRPVKWIEDRGEHFVATTQSRNQVWDLEIAAKANGKILGIRGKGVHDNGAYVPYGLLLPLTAMTPFPGPYTLAAVDLSMEVVYTNMTPTSPVRGAGRPYAAFLIERAVDRVAKALGLDRAEIRRRNFVQPEQMPYPTGMPYRDGSLITYDSGDYPGCLEMALEMADYDGFETRREAAASKGRLLGIGMASYIEDTGVGPYEGATVRVLRSGRILVETGAPSQGQGHSTIFAQIIADALDVDVSRVKVKSADTSRFPMGIGAVGSRIAVTAGSSVHEAAEAVRKKALALTSKLLGVGEQALEIVGGRVQLRGDGDDSKGFTLAELSQMLVSGPGVPLPEGFTAGLESTSYFPATSAIPYANGSQVVEVEVDPDTGLVQLNRYCVAHDCGTLLNPLLVDGQILGGVVHGIGNALFERMRYDGSGQPTSTNYGEYLLPVASEMPLIEIAHIESPSPLNPLGVKGAGEGGTIPAAAAIISAVEDALRGYGIKISRHPISPQDVVGMIDEATV